VRRIELAIVRPDRYITRWIFDRFTEENTMKSMTGLWAACLAAVLLTAGCDQIPGAGPDTLIVDLAAVAKAMGQEQAMQLKSATARQELNAQLVESARNLEQELTKERANAGDAPTPEQAQQLQQMTQQAQQQYGQLQAEAQQQAQQMELNLVLEFRELVEPFAEKIARSRGASVVLLTDQSVFWLDPTVDITGEVIAGLRAADVFPSTGADQAPAAAEPAAAEPAAAEPAAAEPAAAEPAAAEPAAAEPAADQ
jgi:Skp family chaperone for outer membrane proteins